MENQVITRMLKELIRKHDLPPVVFHSLRHSIITYKQKLSGGDIKMVQGDSDHAHAISAVPIEVKSGKDYSVHSALNNFVSNEEYHIQKAFVLSNQRIISHKGKITYLPIYFIMFFSEQPRRCKRSTDMNCKSFTKTPRRTTQ